MSALTDLLAVQDLDLASDRLKHQREHLPERDELTSIASEEGGIRATLSELDQHRGELQERQQQAEAALTATEDRAGTLEKRLYGGQGGQVPAARDLQAMSAEVDQLRLRASHLEDEILEVLEAREPLDAEAAGFEQRVAELESRRGEAEAGLAAAEGAIDEKLRDQEGARAEAVRAVPEGLLATYDRLRSRLGGIGVARLAGNRCDGCHLALSAAELELVHHLPDGAVYQCEQCSRILVP